MTLIYFTAVICCAFKHNQNADYDEVKQNRSQCAVLALQRDLFEMHVSLWPV